MNRAAVIALLVLIVSPLPAVIAATVTSAPIGLSGGAAIGLVGTWIGIALGYVNLRRSLRADAEREMEKTAARVASDLFSTRAATLMDRGTQEQINAKNDERYKNLSDMRDLCQELRHLSITVAAQIAQRSRE